MKLKVKAVHILMLMIGLTVLTFTLNLYSQDDESSRESREMSGNCVIGNDARVINRGNLILSCSWVNNGNFIDTNGTVIFRDGDLGLGGTSHTSYYNLSILSTGNVTAGAPGQAVENILRVEGELQGGGQITLISTSTGTALIDGEGTGNIYGDVIVQRYLEDGFGYMYFSSPFSDGTVGDFSDEIDLGEAFPACYRYDENRISSGWVSYIAESDPLSQLSGYALNFGASHGAFTADGSGTVSNGDIQTTYYHHNQPYTEGFNLAGNPYPSPIDWDAAGWTKINIDDAIYFFNASDTDRYTGSYSSYVNGVSSDGIADNLIPSMQGFFVHVSDGTFPVTGILGCTNNVRTRDPAPVFHKKNNMEQIPYLRLLAGFQGTGYPQDPLVFYFDDQASLEFDPVFDALKLMNSDLGMPSLYALVKPGKRLSICGIPGTDSDPVTIPLGIRAMHPGVLAISAEGIESLPTDLKVYIFDYMTGKHLRIENSKEYLIFPENNQDENRYAIRLSHDDVSDEQGEGQRMFIYQSDGQWIVTTYLGPDDSGELAVISMTGQKLWSEDVTGSNKYVIDPVVPAGIYLLNLAYTGGNDTQKILMSGR